MTVDNPESLKMKLWHLVESPCEDVVWEAVLGDPIRGKYSLPFKTREDAEEFISLAGGPQRPNKGIMSVCKKILKALADSAAPFNLQYALDEAIDPICLPKELWREFINAMSCYPKP